MTAKQTTKALEDAGFNMDAVRRVSRDEAEIYIPEEGEDYADHYKTEAAKQQAQDILGWGGFRTGYGSWVLRNGYRAAPSINCR